VSHLRGYDTKVTRADKYSARASPWDYLTVRVNALCAFVFGLEFGSLLNAREHCALRFCGGGSIVVRADV
jgi:hypothetical protein